MGTSAEDELFGPPKIITNSDVYRIFKLGEIIHMPHSDTDWETGPVQKERDRHVEEITEAPALCIATQVRGPSPGAKAVMKIKIQIPEWPEGTTHYEDCPTITDEMVNEVKVMQILTERNCSCTPHLIDFNLTNQTEDHFVPGGYVLVLLMEKVPGCNLRDFGEFPLGKAQSGENSFCQGSTVRFLRSSLLFNATDIVHSEFYQFGVHQRDRARRNIIYDEENERCYFVDMDAVEWGCPPRGFDPFLDVTEWCLKSPLVTSSQKHNDPMVPSGEREEYADTDEALLALATRTDHAAKVNP